MGICVDSMLSPEEIEAIRLYRGKSSSEVALRLRKSPSLRPQVVATQVDCWQRLKAKVPSWAVVDGLYFPSSLPLQQCSSEVVARWRRSLVEGSRLIDLTGGLGVDCFFMSEGIEATYVEPNADLLNAVRHNYSALGKTGVEFINSNAEEVAGRMNPNSFDTLFIDPSRRSDAGGRVFLLDDCAPNVIDLAPTLLDVAKVVIVKLSTLLDISTLTKQLPNITDIFVVEVRGECKDLVVRMSKDAESGVGIRYHSVSLATDGSESRYSYSQGDEESAQAIAAGQVGDYLFEPSPSLMKLGPYKLLSEQFGVSPLSMSTHLYTADVDVPQFPGRRFKVERVVQASKRGYAEVGKLFPKASVAVRNFNISAEELRKRLKVGEDCDRFIYGTSLGNKEYVLVAATRLATNA